MKLPKGFGGQGFGGMMNQAQEAMRRAQTLEDELANDRLQVDKGPVKATFTGTGMLVDLKIDPSLLDPEDVESLETMVVAVVRDGFEQATERRAAKVAEIMPNIPGMPGF